MRNIETSLVILEAQQSDLLHLNWHSCCDSNEEMPQITTILGHPILPTKLQNKTQDHFNIIF